MTKTIQLRHMPDELHRKLKAKAALEGSSLSDYLLKEIQRVPERPTLAEPSPSAFSAPDPPDSGTLT